MAKPTFQKPKGTADLLPEQTAQWQHIESIARLLFGDYTLEKLERHYLKILTSFPGQPEIHPML